jgi:predicted kinase
MLIILCGPPCTGKSTIGADLQKRLAFIHLDVDTIRQRLLPDSDQRMEDRNIAYRAMHFVAEHLVRSGQIVIVNATYNREVHRRDVAAITTNVKLIQCRTSLETVLSRFNRRAPGHAAVDLTEGLVRELWTKFSWSNDGVQAESTAEALDHINRPGPDSLENWVRMQ